MPLYPPSLIYLTLPLEWSLSFFSLAHLWWAGLGMYFLARRWTGNDFAAAFAGVAFAFNGFTLNLLMWPSHIATFSWLPWVVLATELAWRKGGRHIFLASIVGALQMLAGGPETIFLTWLIVAALWLPQFINNKTARAELFLRLQGVGLLVFALSAAQLLPFLDLVVHAQRETGYTDLRWSMPGFGLANFLVPMAFGSTTNAGIFFQHGQYWTSSYYLGLGTLWLALMAFWSTLTTQDSGELKSKIRFLAFAGIIALLCALGENTPFYPLLRKIIPQLSFITYPVKFIMVAVFAAPLLAALVLANFHKKQKRILPLGAALLTLLGVIIFWTQHSPMPGDNTAAAFTNGISRAIFLLLTGAILFALTRSATSPLLRFAPLALLLVAWLDVFTHEPRQNPTVPPSVFAPNLARTKLAMQPQPELGGSRAMLSPAAALELTRFAVSDPQNNFLAKRLGYCGNANLLDAVPKVDGFFSLTPREFDNVLTMIYSATNTDFTALKNFLGVAQTTAPENLLAWQARPNFLPLVTAGQKPVFVDYMSSGGGELAHPDFDSSKMVFLSVDDKTSIRVTNQTSARVLTTKFTTQTVDAEVDAAEPSLVVVAQTYYHNWRVTVDGQPAPLLQANYAFQAVQVPAGQHRVHFYYRDQSFVIGLALTVVGLLVCAVGFLVFRRPQSVDAQS